MVAVTVAFPQPVSDARIWSFRNTSSIWLPETTGLVLPSRVGTAGRMRNTLVLGPVSGAGKGLVSPVSVDFRTMGLVSATVGSRLDAPALACTHSGEPLAVAWVTL